MLIEMLKEYTGIESVGTPRKFGNPWHKPYRKFLA